MAAIVVPEEELEIVEHRAELGDPSFGAFMKGCRCDDCRESHRSVSANRAGSGTGSAKTTRGRKGRRETVRTAVTDESPLHALAGTSVPHRGAGTSASETELEEFAGSVLVAVTGILAMLLFHGQPAVKEAATMTDEEANLIGSQFARWFSTTTTNRKHGAKVVQAGGLIAAGVALAEYGDRLLQAVKESKAAQPATSSGRPRLLRTRPQTRQEPPREQPQPAPSPPDFLARLHGGEA